MGVLKQSRNLSGLSDSELDELMSLLDDYQPVLGTFIVKWKQLGSHPKADRFWNMDLQSSEMKLDSTDKITTGYYKKDQVLYISGWDLNRESSLLSMESEKEMILVRDSSVK